MALYPFILNDNIGASINREKIHNSFALRNAGYQSQFSTASGKDSWEIRRIRKLSGFMFLITVKFEGSKFFIIGDMKEE
jgi:hypothetical protein